MWPFKRNEPKSAPVVAETKAVLGLNDELSKFLQLGRGTGATPASALNLYDSSSAVSIPINKIGDALAGLTPVLKNEEGEIIRDHPVLDLLRQPSPYYDQGLFLETLGKNYLITDEAYVIASGNRNFPPVALDPITPNNVSIPEGRGGAPGSIMITGSTLTGTYVPDTRKKRLRYFNGGMRELHYIRGFSTKNNSLLRGQSLLVSASNEVRQHIEGGKHNVSLLEKGGRMSLVFHFEEEMSQPDLEAARDRVNERYGGAAHAGEIGLTSGGKLSINELSKTNRDMDFAELQKMAKFAVCLQYKVPLPLVTVDAQTFDNYGQANLALYDDAVLPLANRIFSNLTTLLMPRYGEDPRKIRLTYDIDDITALAMRRNEELKLRKELGVETDNEMRGMIGREPYNGGDVIYKQANMIPVGNDQDTDDPQVVRDHPLDE